MLKVSIVTVSYNSVATIRQTIESVLVQSYHNIEYIVIDGASTDGTADIVRSFGDRVDYFVSEPDSGIYNAMNKGIARSTGDIVGLLNADDMFESPSVVAEIVSCFEQNPSVEGVYADLYYVKKDNINKAVRHWVTGQQRTFAKGWHPAHPALYLKRQLYDNLGFFDESYKLAADFDLMLRFIEKNRILLYYLQKPIVRMRLGGSTNKNFGNIVRGNRECFRAFKKNGIAVSPFYSVSRLLPKIKQYFT